MQGMMDGLAAWLKQIVAVVLLAGLVDLMLPNRALQRYVRLVAGLLILLTVATPLLQFLKGDFSSKMAEEWDKFSVQGNQAVPASMDLRRIEAEAGRWRKQREEDAALFAAARLREAIRLDVENYEGRKVEDVTVLLGRSQAGEVTVERVTVLLAGPKDEPLNASAGPEPIARVEAVAPVIIDLNLQTKPQDEQSDENRVTDPQTRYRIEALIAAKYNVPSDGITVLEAARRD
jgi:stage III sporulation protein AF